jgi:hypothetical protein
MIDIIGAVMHANINELIHVQLEDPMTELLTWVDPDKYQIYMVEEKQWQEGTVCHALESTLWDTASCPPVLGKLEQSS